ANVCCRISEPTVAGATRNDVGAPIADDPRLRWCRLNRSLGLAVILSLRALMHSSLSGSTERKFAVAPPEAPQARALDPKPNRVAFVTLALPQRVYSLRRDNLRILAMLTDQQGRGAPDVHLRSHPAY